MKSLNNSNKNKMKTKATNLQNSNGEPFYLENERGVVGVSTGPIPFLVPTCLVS